MPGLTPSQSVGPFFHEALLRDQALDVVARPGTQGERILIEGRLLDGDGSGVDDGLVEVWQADARGRYRDPSDGWDRDVDETFRGFGRCATDETGAFRFETVKPGALADGEGGEHGGQAPHLLVLVFAAGLLDHLVTRVYFSDEPGNDADPVLRQVPEERRSTLVARLEEGGDATRREHGDVADGGQESDGVTRYRFDIHLQGPDETVFFAF